MRVTKQLEPIQGEKYRLDYILRTLKLPDSPSLCFDYQGQRAVIQCSHITHTELLLIAGFAKSEWRYVRETSEWIPIFEYVSTNWPITDFVTIDQPIEGSAFDGLWVCPKGFYREQLGN